LLRLDKSAAADSYRPGEVFQLGKARRVREGHDVTLIATGGILGEALAAAGLLSRESIHCRVLSMHTIKPLDTQELCAAALETGGIVTIEEHSVEGGLGGAVAENLLEGGVIPRFFFRLGLRGFSSIVGSQQYLRKVYSLDAASIAAVVAGKLRAAMPAFA
jgi:transketolase